MVATDRFEMRVDPADRARWEEEARQDGRTLARWLTVVANQRVAQLEMERRARKGIRRSRGIAALERTEANNRRKK